MSGPEFKPQLYKNKIIFSRTLYIERGGRRREKGTYCLILKYIEFITK
jgi:hypothetical protein